MTTSKSCTKCDGAGTIAGYEDGATRQHTCDRCEGTGRTIWRRMTKTEHAIWLGFGEPPLVAVINDDTFALYGDAGDGPLLVIAHAGDCMQPLEASLEGAQVESADDAERVVRSLIGHVVIEHRPLLETLTGLGFAI